MKTVDGNVTCERKTQRGSNSPNDSRNKQCNDVGLCTYLRHVAGTVVAADGSRHKSRFTRRQGKHARSNCGVSHLTIEKCKLNGYLLLVLQHSAAVEFNPLLH